MEQLEGRRLQQWLECHVCAKYEVEQQRRVLWCVTELVRLRRKHFDVSKLLWVLQNRPLKAKTKQRALKLMLGVLRECVVHVAEACLRTRFGPGMCRRPLFRDRRPTVWESGATVKWAHQLGANKYSLDERTRRAPLWHFKRGRAEGPGTCATKAPVDARPWPLANNGSAGV